MRRGPEGHCPECGESTPDPGMPCPPCQDVLDEHLACPGCGGSTPDPGDYCPGCEDIAAEHWDNDGDYSVETTP
jgi:hypothetical protein